MWSFPSGYRQSRLSPTSSPSNVCPVTSPSISYSAAHSHNQVTLCFLCPWCLHYLLWMSNSPNLLSMFCLWNVSCLFLIIRSRIIFIPVLLKTSSLLICFVHAILSILYLNHITVVSNLIILALVMTINYIH